MLYKKWRAMLSLRLQLWNSSDSSSVTPPPLFFPGLYRSHLCNSIFTGKDKVVTVTHCLLFQCCELSAAQKENEKLKEDLNCREIKVKWAQNKLRTELDAHKVVISRIVWCIFFWEMDIRGYCPLLQLLPWIQHIVCMVFHKLTLFGNKISGWKLCHTVSNFRHT